MTWRAPLRATCLFCHEAKEEPKPAKVFREPNLKYCILCYVEEGVSICRKCLVPWQAAYDSNNAFSQVLKYARAEDEPHMLCLYCVAEDFGNEEELTLPANALDDTARLQLTKICKVVAKFGPAPIEVITRETLNLKPAPFAQGAASSAQGAASGAQGAASSAQGAERQPAVQITTTTLAVHPRITGTLVSADHQYHQDRTGPSAPAGRNSDPPI